MMKLKVMKWFYNIRNYEKGWKMYRGKIGKVKNTVCFLISSITCQQYNLEKYLQNAV